MNKTAIKNFAIWAKAHLITAVKERAYEYKITENGENKLYDNIVGGRMLTNSEADQRNRLIKEISENGFDHVIEEAAYTWFNRFITLRFMEVNGFLPLKEDCFASELLNNEDQIQLKALENAKIFDFFERNRDEELFKSLIITTCNILSRLLPCGFEKIPDHIILLFPCGLLNKEGFIGKIVSDIDEEDWQDNVQIIGWLHQYYNVDLKNDTFAKLKRNIKISEERLPAATQLFTPEWIVRYMVENSLGRLYISDRLSSVSNQSESERIEAEKAISEKMGWKYYIPEAEQSPEVRAQLNGHFNVADIKVIDPCMGSGHILVYAFDVLMQIYTACGFSKHDAVRSILENNLFGLDIDDHAEQLSCFAVMMKAVKYSNEILNCGIKPNFFAIENSDFIDENLVDLIAKKDIKIKNDLITICTLFKNAKEFGSALQVPKMDFSKLYKRIEEFEKIQDKKGVYKKTVTRKLLKLVKSAELMSLKYDVVVTNPPYMGNGSMSEKLKDFVKNEYPNSKSDMFAVFIERCGQMLKNDGYQAMVTMHSWMFLSSYENLRHIVYKKCISSLIHLGANAFGGDVGTIVQNAAFVIRNSCVPNYIATYHRLVDYNTSEKKERAFLRKENVCFCKNDFTLIPGIPLAYWISEKFKQTFKNPPLSSIAKPHQGLITADNNRFVRAWYEVNYPKIGFYTPEEKNHYKKWVPFANGGGFCKWYGLHTDVVNWENDGFEIKNNKDINGKVRSRPQNVDKYFNSGITWNAISTELSVRNLQEGFIFSNASMAMFADKNVINYILALMNSKYATEVLKVLCPTFNFNAGDMNNIPIIFSQEKAEEINDITENNKEICKTDFDSFETSWDFKKHPLI